MSLVAVVGALTRILHGGEAYYRGPYYEGDKEVLRKLLQFFTERIK